MEYIWKNVDFKDYQQLEMNYNERSCQHMFWMGKKCAKIINIHFQQLSKKIDNGIFGHTGKKKEIFV